MKWWMAILVGVLMWQPVVLAQEEEEATPAVLNDPPTHYGTFKRVVDTLEPTYEQIYDFKSGEWFNGFSTALYQLKSRDIHLLSLRAGYAVDYKAYAGIKLDAPGIVQRYLPQQAQDWLSPGFVSGVWTVVGKYAYVGPYVGYDWDSDDPIVGIGLGGTVRF